MLDDGQRRRRDVIVCDHAGLCLIDRNHSRAVAGAALRVSSVRNLIDGVRAGIKADQRSRILGAWKAGETWRVAGHGEGEVSRLLRSAVVVDHVFDHAETGRRGNGELFVGADARGGRVVFVAAVPRPPIEHAGDVTSEHLR